MIQSLSIKNFKKIGDPGIQLQDLGRVNYLVGENGCGKSSIIEGIYAKLKNAKPKTFVSADIQILPDQPHKPYVLVHNNNILNANYSVESFIPSSSSGEFRNRGEQNLQYLDVIEYSHIQLLDINFPGYNRETNFSTEMQDNIKTNFNSIFKGTLEISKIEKLAANPDIGELTLQFYATTNSGDSVNLNYMAGGYLYFLKLIILLSIKENQDKNILLIEEPEQQLNPKIQKLIPKFLKSLTDTYPDKQFFVTTHSPFVISAATEFDDQRVYRIENGKCLNPNGSRGARVIFESARMLGMGMSDFIVAPTAEIKNKSYIVYCESNKTSGSSDAEIYNIIFRKYKNVLFISCGSCEDVYHQYIASTEFYKTQVGQIKVIGLIDNDPENTRIEEWKLIGLTVLGRREIENYLYDPEIISAIGAINTDVMELLSGIDVSQEDLKKNTKINQALKNEHERIAAHITIDMTIYKELNECIFG